VINVISDVIVIISSFILLLLFICYTILSNACRIYFVDQYKIVKVKRQNLFTTMHWKP